jgi:hypothetical protein
LRTMRMREVPLPPRTGETARVRDVVAGALNDADVPTVGETARMREVVTVDGAVTVEGAVTIAELAMLPVERPLRSVPMTLPPVVTAAVRGVVVTLEEGLEEGAIAFTVAPVAGGVAVLPLTFTVPTVAAVGLTTCAEETVGLTTDVLPETGEGFVDDTTVGAVGLVTTAAEETVGLTTNALREAGEGIVDDATFEPARPLVTFAFSVGVAPLAVVVVPVALLLPAAVPAVPAIVSGAVTPVAVVAFGVTFVVPIVVPLLTPAVPPAVVTVPFVVGTMKMPLPSSPMMAGVPRDDSVGLTVDCGFTDIDGLMACPVWGSSTTTVPLGAGSAGPRYFVRYSLWLAAGSLAKYALIIGAFPPLELPTVWALYALVIGALPP